MSTFASRALRGGIQAAWVASLHGAWRRFQRAAGDPERAQEKRLAVTLSANADTAYGRAHRFADVATVS